MTLTPPVRIDYDENGDLDDIVIENVTMFRMERMSDNTFWIRCYRDNGKDVVFNLSSKKKIIGNHEFD